ncbi:MAG: hypothetical protein H0X25_20125, partial [Acidobacteriales bacterium]|nr:hypothetical protein [Terriglobales bacterium]
ADGGKLTAADKAKIDKQQAILSRNIKNQSTDAQKLNTSPTSEVGKRNENQQDRIAQGIASGQLTPAEASRLERNDTRIAREVRNERNANGGALTSSQRQQINRQDNRNSQQIYRAKHKARHF